MVLADTFGINGTASAFFGGADAWWLVGLLLLLIFLIFLMAYNVNAETITLFLVIGMISVGMFQLWAINEQITQTILFLVFMFVGYMAYLWFSR
jgi:hypothetical protein